MFVSSKIEVYKERYPYADKVNSVLHQFICENSFSEDSRVPGTAQTPFDYRPLYDLKEFGLIVNYARSFITNKEIFSNNVMEWKLELLTWWGMLSNKGSYQNWHDHLPNHWSFVYYMNTPKGSSPLIFRDGNKKIHPKAGDLVIFPARLSHKVPPNKCIGRTSVVGNFYWKTKYIAFAEADSKNSMSLYNLE